jgi:DNA-binding HxlR family transcriptional regulator
MAAADPSSCGCVSPVEHGADCYCSVSPLIHALGKRHALSIISFLGGQDKVRFSAIQDRFSGLSSSTLAARLQELEESGLIARSVFDEQNKVEYRLTPRGRALRRSLAALFPRR